MPIPSPEARGRVEPKKVKLTIAFDGRSCTITSDAMENPSWLKIHQLTKLLGVDEWVVLDDSFKIKISKKYLEGNLSEPDREKVSSALQQVFGQDYELSQS